MYKVKLKDGSVLKFEKVEYIQNDFIGVVGIYCYKKTSDKDWSLYSTILGFEYIIHE